MRDKYKHRAKKKAGASSQSQSRLASRHSPPGKPGKDFPSSAHLKNASQVSRRKPKAGHMSVSYSALKKPSVRRKGGSRKKGAREWEAPESMARAGSRKKGSTSPGRGKAYDKKKLSKVVALFNKEVFAGLDVKSILNNWRILQYVFLSLGGKKPLEAAVNTYFVNTFRKDYERFLRGFTKYNKIRKKIFVFMFLEFWAFYLLFYFHFQLGHLEPKVRALFEDVLTHLTKNTFYVGLILLKAASNRVLALNVGYLQDFVNRSQTFNFETGVPLIKTLRSNNENAYEGLKKVLQSTNRSLNKFFGKTYAEDFASFERFVAFGAPVFASQLQSPGQVLFKKMQDSHFYGKETFSGKAVSPFCADLRRPMAPEEFLRGSLDPARNSWAAPEPEAKRGLSRTLHEGPARAKKAKREASLSEKQALRGESKKERGKQSVRSRNSGAARSKISSKYSLQQLSQSRKAKGLLGGKAYKLKASNSKRFKNLSGMESPRRPREPKAGKLSALASRKKLERSLRKQSSKAFKVSRQGSVREKEARQSRKQKHASVVASSKTSSRARLAEVGAEAKPRKKTREAEQPRNALTSKRGLPRASREGSTRRAAQSKRGSRRPRKEGRNGRQWADQAGEEARNPFAAQNGPGAEREEPGREDRVAEADGGRE